RSGNGDRRDVHGIRRRTRVVIWLAALRVRLGRRRRYDLTLGIDSRPVVGTCELCRCHKDLAWIRFDVGYGKWSLGCIRLVRIPVVRRQFVLILDRAAWGSRP